MLNPSRCLDPIYKLIHCDTVAIINLTGDGEAMYVDDEGLMTTHPDREDRIGTRFFVLTDPVGRAINLVAGRGLILGCDREGNTIATTLTPEMVRPHVKWVNDNAVACELAEEICGQTTCVSTQAELDAVRERYADTMCRALDLTQLTPPQHNAFPSVAL